MFSTAIAYNNAAFYPYYGRLNAAQRRLYEQLLPGCRNAKEKIPVTVPARFQDASEVMNAICYDHPELFWVTQKSVVLSNSVTGCVAAVEPRYLFGPAQIPKLQSALNAALRTYLAAAAGKTPAEQERILHDKMVRDVSYVRGPNDQTAYGALVEHRAVCAGYTRAFQLLMQQCGIPCYYCYGEGKGPADAAWNPHAWNILQLGGEYYNMDITWDDCFEKTAPGKISYRYYNCDDRQIAGNHRRAAACAFLPACRGTRYSFRGVTGTDPELEEIFQEGVTCRQVIRSVPEFERYILPAIRKTAGRPTTVSFPVQTEGKFEPLQQGMSEAIRRALAGRTCRWRGTWKNYGGSWYRMQYKIEYK